MNEQIQTITAKDRGIRTTLGEFYGNVELTPGERTEIEVVTEPGATVFPFLRYRLANGRRAEATNLHSGRGVVADDGGKATLSIPIPEGVSEVEIDFRIDKPDEDEIFAFFAVAVSLASVA